MSLFWLVYSDGTLRGGDRLGMFDRVIPQGGVVVVVVGGGGSVYLFEVLRCDNHACCQGRIGVCKRIIVLSARGLL